MGKEENTKVMWYDVYRELAKLLAKTNGEELYKSCLENDEFKGYHAWSKNFFETEKIHNEVGTFDPLQVFASFNGFGMSDSVRTKKINLYFEILGSEKNYKNIDFSGCPTPMILHLVAIRTRIGWNTEKYIKEHGKNAHVNLEEEKKAQGKIWKAFKQVIKEDYSSIDFEDLKTVFGVNLNSFSLLLFWIDSRNFLPLDKNTLALFETNNQDIAKTIQTWDEYLKFLKLKDTDIYQIITSMAWEGCSYETLSKKTKEVLAEFGIKKCPQKSLKIIAIKPLEGCNKDFLKGLKENQIYLFDKAYSIDDNGNITYHKEKDIQLFNQDGLQVNINAIVGKNGTGKSTLIELFLAIINNVTYQQQNKDCIKYIENLKVEFIFEDLHIYKVKVANETITLFEYIDNNKWKEIKNLNHKQFFYNILVNYSIHSLDSSKNSWINSHFDNKCRTDIMIEPFREDGNINIQEEEKRVKERLIVNLLEPEPSKEDEYSFRQLTDRYRAIKLLSNSKLNKSKKNKSLLIFYSDTNDLKDCFSEHKIEELSEKINDSKDDDKSIKDFIPNNYFNDILLDNDIKFSQLSSGEKQKIYSINSIVYHIKEIDRKKKYKHINLILDEIELYFHPELQRTYISDVIKAIKKVGTENILGINITFITHSPFILSDIPESKILFLDKESKDIDAKTVPQERSVKTFGANIHTLLSDSFFMENGLMGEFAKGKINEIINFHKEVNIENKKEKPNFVSLQEEYEKHKTKFWNVQSIIGEDYLRQVIKNHLRDIENILLGHNGAKQEEIKRVEAYLESLKK